MLKNFKPLIFQFLKNPFLFFKIHLMKKKIKRPYITSPNENESPPKRLLNPFERIG
jgi:hypothetical protein